MTPVLQIMEYVLSIAAIARGLVILPGNTVQQGLPHLLRTNIHVTVQAQEGHAIGRPGEEQCLLSTCLCSHVCCALTQDSSFFRFPAGSVELDPHGRCYHHHHDGADLPVNQGSPPE